jgi:transposase
MELPQDISSLHLLLQECFSKLASLEAENATLRAENGELRRRLGMDSSNSHKPPSSDGYKKKSVKPAIPKEGGKKQGGQAGHQGKSLKMVSEPTTSVIHHPSSCSCCGRVFEQDSFELLDIRRQVFDIPVPHLEVTEHRISRITCCGQSHIGSFPQGVTAPVQYGVRALTLASMLNVDFRMPYHKVSQLFEDIYGSSINESTVFSANERLYAASQAIEQEIKESLLSSEVAHVDETGMRVEGKLQWFHTVCNASFCYIFVHAKRGLEALRSSCSLAPDLKNWMVHDCWQSYFDFDNCSHALCNAHILRELRSLTEQGSVWASKMSQFLLDLYQASEKGSSVVKDFDHWQKKYEDICCQADQEEPPPQKSARGRPKNTKGRNLLNRLKEHQAAVLAFARVEVVPFTNNRAEQDIRVIKTKQKVAMSFRTFDGAKVYARIQGVIKTIRKQKRNLFQTLTNINANIPTSLRTT